ncbi:MAG: DUF6597 domain-containing transcriptional factor [Thermoleophilaceae bacterium]
MTYRELDPPAALGRWVECAWEVVTGGEERRVVPDGCIDVVWTPAELPAGGRQQHGVHRRDGAGRARAACACTRALRRHCWACTARACATRGCR